MSFDFGALWDDILLKTLNINLGNLFGTGESQYYLACKTKLKAIMIGT